MKFILWIIAISLMACIHGLSATLTFDNLSPNGGFIDVPIGYGGVTWSNFLVVDAVASESAGSGYRIGMISPNNDIFDSYAQPASISSSKPFNLTSAFLTAGLDDGLNVEVQGFVGNNMVYDNTYTVNTESASLISLNYNGVTTVNFIPFLDRNAGTSSQFVLDNVVIVVPEPKTSQLLLIGILLLSICKLRLCPDKSPRALLKHITSPACLSSGHWRTRTNED